MAEVTECFNQVIEYLEKDVAPAFQGFNGVSEDNNHITVEVKNLMKEIQDTLDEFVEFIDTVNAQMDLSLIHISSSVMNLRSLQKWTICHRQNIM